MDTIKILIVEDDPHINHILSDGLSANGFDCFSAYSGTEGKLLVQQDQFDLLILDLMLPGLSGKEFLHFLRNEKQDPVPVIILSAKDELDSKLQLFSEGADDYMTKPFELEELIARVHARLKSEPKNTTEQKLIHKNLLLDSLKYAFFIHEQEISLTRQEFRILELLIKNPTRVFTKQELYERAWEDTYLGEDKTVAVHISNIRNKIKAFDPENYIDTIWGIGFRLGK